MTLDLDRCFPRYRDFDPAVPVWCVTPEDGRIIHRFFDTSPFSPSARYLGLTRLPYEDRLPAPGDAAEVVVVDLHTGESRVVAETRGWDTQVGAHVQWGVDDSQLFFNDVDVETWDAFGVELDPGTGTRKDLGGPVYMISSDGRRAASPCLLRVGATQPGYGVVVPPAHVPVNRGAPPDDGVYVTDTETGRSRLLVSLRRIVETAEPSLRLEEFAAGDFYAFHVKWNPGGDRLQVVLRWLPNEPDVGARMRAQLITMRADGSEIRVAVPASEWSKGGHHPNWCPDGEHVLMNLRLDGANMRFVSARHDGSGLRALADDLVGSGHPTMHPDGRHILTDAYPHEPVSYGDGTVPIRLIDIATGEERVLIRIPSEPATKGPRGELRVDPHPAWDRAFRRIAFNAFLGGTRRVCVADLEDEVS